MQLFFVVGTVNNPKGETSIVCDAYVAPTLDVALHQMVNALAESHPLDVGWSGHAAQGFPVSQELINKVVASQKSN